MNYNLKVFWPSGNTPVNIGFSLIVCILISLTVLNYTNMRQYEHDNQWVTHTHHVKEVNAVLLSAVKDAETSQRGFIITHHNNFLNNYLTGQQRYITKVKLLEHLTTDNKLQQKRIDTLKRMVNVRFRLLEHSLKLIRTKSRINELHQTLEAGKLVMDSIRIVSYNIDQEEQRLLNLRQAKSRRANRLTKNVFYGSIGIVLILFITVFYHLLRQLKLKARAERELSIGKQWYSQTLRGLSDGVIATSVDHKVTYMNKAAEQLTFYKEGEVLQLPIEEVINLKDERTGEVMEAPTRTAITQKSNVRLEFQTLLIRRNKSALYIDIGAAPVTDPEGNLQGAVLVFRDVTEEIIAKNKLKIVNEDLEAKVLQRTRKLEEEIEIRKKVERNNAELIKNLVQANKDLEQFIYIISHNFRKPVANILGLLDLLNVHEHHSEDAMVVNFLAKEVNQLDMVLKDLGTLTTVRKNQTENTEQLPVFALINILADSFEYELKKAGGRIEVQVTPNDRVYAISSYFNSIILNLISNAIKYRNPGRPLVITITCDTTEGYDIIRVKDNGLGIDINKHGDKLFGLYNRFHLHIEGKGLGLQISKTQMEMMGGRIEVKSDVDQGAEFTLFFKKLLVSG